MFKKTSMWVGLTAVVLASCGGGSSETKDTSATESTDRERNTLVGGFGTDGAGYSDVALGKSNSSGYSQPTTHDNGDGTTNVAVISSGSKNGEPFLQVLLSRIGKDGAFDTSYGDKGFTYITLVPEHWVSTMMFDSHNNVVVAVQWSTEIPGEKDAYGQQAYQIHSELRAYSFAKGEAQNDYWTNGVLTDSEKTLGSDVYDVSLGLRGLSANSFNLMTSDGLVQLAADGTTTNPIIMPPLSAGIQSRLIDMSLLTSEDYGNGLIRNLYDQNGELLKREFSFIGTTVPEAIIYTDITEDESMLKGSVVKQYAVPSANNAKPNIMVITSAEVQVDRAKLDTETKTFHDIENFSFDESDDSNFGGATIAPTGTTLVGLEYKYSGQQNLITCNVEIVRVCETGAAQRLALPGIDLYQGHVRNTRVETDGTIRLLIKARNSDGVSTDAVVSLGADGIPSTLPVEPYASSLATQPASEGNTWTYGCCEKIGADSAVMVAGTMAGGPAVGVISSSAGVRSVKQNKKPVQVSPTGRNVWTDTQHENLLFDEKGSEYVYAGEGNDVVGYARILPADGQIDTSYGEQGLASFGASQDCVGYVSQFAPNGQLMVLQIQREKVDTECDDNVIPNIISAAVISPQGAVTSTVFATPLLLDNRKKLIISPLTSEFYLYSQKWIGSDTDLKIEHSISRYNAQGELDQTFGTAGKLTYSDDSILDWPVSPQVADNKGRLLFVGTSSDGANDVLRVARITREGKLDMGADAPPPPVHTPEEKREAREEQKRLEANPVQPVAEAAVITPISITEVITAGDGKVKVTWVDAMKYATPPTYTVTATPGGKSCTSTTTTCDIAGLDAWQSYTFAVSTSGKVAATSAPSAEVKPVRVAKVGSKTSLRKLLTPGGKTTVKWATTGGCKISGTSFVAANKPGICLLTAKTAKVGKAASTVRFVRVQVVAATKK